MDNGLLSLIVLLLFGVIVYALISIVNYIGYKRRHDQQLQAKIDQIIELLSKNEE